MADDRAYRIQVQYVSEEGYFLAQAPELGIEASAASRSEALKAIETAIDEAMEQAAVDGRKLPRPADLSGETGELTLELAGPVWRDLSYHAQAQKLEPAALALQLLTRALGHMEGRSNRRHRTAAPSTEAKAAEPSEETEGNAKNERKEGAKNNRRGRGRRREGYRPDMEDQANFLAYVRDQERGGRGRR